MLTPDNDNSSQPPKLKGPVPPPHASPTLNVGAFRNRPHAPALDPKGSQPRTPRILLFGPTPTFVRQLGPRGSHPIKSGGTRARNMHHARPFSRSRRVGGRCVKMPLGLGIGGWLCASPRGFAGPSAGLCTLQCIDSNIPLAGARSEFGGPIRSIPPPLASSTRIHSSSHFCRSPRSVTRFLPAPLPSQPDCHTH